MGYSAVVTAAMTFYFDWQFGWEKTKHFTFWAVVAYFILNGALTVWVWGVEKGSVFLGHMDGTQVSRTGTF